MSRATIMAVVNQKGGTGKTTTCENLGIGLANEGKRVLLVDTDPQASLTIALGHPRPDDIPVTLTDLMAKVMQDQPIAPKEGILSHEEGVDLVPANITLSGMEVSLVNAMSRETVLRQVLDALKFQYDYILLDCMPSLGMLTVNALAASDQVLIPVQANYLSAKGLEQLLQTVNKVKRQINPKLRIEGILLTTRKIFLPKTVAEMLVDWKREQDFTKEALGSEYADFDLVMANGLGMPTEQSRITALFAELIVKNDLPKVVFHSLRHSSITYKLKLNGGDIKSVQGDSGHAQAQMVTDQYSHILDDDRKNNAALFEKAFYSGKGSDSIEVPAETESEAKAAPSGVDPELLAKILSNPEMAALLTTLAKSLN